MNYNEIKLNDLIADDVTIRRRLDGGGVLIEYEDSDGRSHKFHLDRAEPT
jgi:hypothetical protein